MKSTVLLTARATLCAASILAPLSSVGFDRWDISPAMLRQDHLSSQWGNWLIAAEDASSFSLAEKSINFSLRPLKAAAGPLKADWWKPGLIHKAAMAADGVYAEPDQGGIELEIDGLPPGKHSLATFHNFLWREAPSAVEIRVIGQPGSSVVMPSRQAVYDEDVACGYVTFAVQDGESVKICLTAHASQGAKPSRLVLNGIQLDRPNPNRQARRPTPTAADEHAPVRPLLTWRPADGAVAHDLYLGSNRLAVERANRESPEYRGRLSAATYQSDAADPLAEYFWRVDEVFDDSGQDVVEGDVWRFAVGRLAFPDAEGYGRFARGGRGGRVIEVTNLNDRGPGSLRAALEAEGPRTVVFAVSGLITLESRLVIKHPYVTIAGQTAPGKGICVRKYPLGLSGAHDAVIRHLRVRPGAIAGITLDGMGMAGSDHSIIDHCSISWSIDEAFSSRAARNISLQHTLISEALNDAGHKNYPPGTQHGYAASIGGHVGSFHHNLLAHCAGRNWSLAGGLDAAGRHAGWLDIRNNVVYNWKHRTTDGGAAKVQFVNNYYKSGPATKFLNLLNPERDNVAAFGPQIYFVEGNVLEGHYGADESLAGVTQPEPYEKFISAEPFFEPFVETQTAEQAFALVLSDVGCSQPELDEHDVRVIDETLKGVAQYSGSRTGLPGLPDSEADVGGWENYPEVRRPDDWDADHDGMPNWWEAAHGLDANSPSGFAESNADADDDGFTNLEEYLDWMAQPHFEGKADDSLDIDVRKLCRGWPASAKLEVSDAIGGAVVLTRDAATAQFTPSAEGPLVGSFLLTVRNEREPTSSRRVGIRIVR